MGARWRIYYANGATYSDRDGDPFNAPTTGAQVVAEETTANAKGFMLTHSRDAFYWKAGSWWACDQLGLWDYLLEHRGPKAILLGRSLRDEDFWAVVNRAKIEGVG